MLKQYQYFFVFMLILYIINDVSSENITEYQSDIMGLFKNVQTFQYPTNHSDFYHDHFEDAGTYGTFDFIIIGAGSAGTLLANRLSQFTAWKILLLEGGGEDSRYTDIPAMAGLLQFTKYNWGYRSTKQKGCCLGMTDQKCNIPRGKSLGGSSTINYMLYTRGNKNDYNQWAAAGNPGWTYEELFPYFVRMENSSLTENYDKEYHGTNGTLHVEHVKHFTEFGQSYMDANVELGRKILDYNGKEQMGFSRPQLTTINGRRCSGNKAFLAPIREARKNLTVQINAFATKLIICKKSKETKGVEFVIGDKKYQAFATKEVILSAGAVGSPHLLMLSGIGPKKHLQELNIPVIQNLPVGKKLADHPFFFQMFHSNFVDPGVKPLDEMINEYMEGKGFFTNPANCQALGFINTEQKEHPDIEHMFVPFIATNDGFLSRGIGYNDETMKALSDEFPNGGAALLLILQHPKSRGTLKLKSSNPFDHPLIDLNYFENEEDVDVLLASIKDMLKVMEGTESMKKYNVSLPSTPLPACKEIPFLTDEYWRCAIRHLSTSLYHLMGTCKMGPDTDPDAVVDHELKVKGIKKLRVVDVSIFPMPITGHTNVPTYTVAEKASDLLMKKHYGLISFYN